MDDAVDKAEQLLAEQRNYFYSSGNSSNLVRSATQFSAAIRRNRPTQALTWARLEKDVEPWNSYAWNNEAIELFPDDIALRFGLGVALTKVGRVEEAENHYRHAKRRFLDEVFPCAKLAELLIDQGRLPDAEHEYRKAHQRFPDNYGVWNGLARVLRLQGRLDEADAEYATLAEKFPHKAVSLGNVYDIFFSMK